MEEIIIWLKDNGYNEGDEIEIVTPQFERTEKRDYVYVPRTSQEFYSVLKTAPLNILLGLGFRKWDTMNNLIKENMVFAGKTDKIAIPIINSPRDQPNRYKGQKVGKVGTGFALYKGKGKKVTRDKLTR